MTTFLYLCYLFASVFAGDSEHMFAGVGYFEDHVRQWPKTPVSPIDVRVAKGFGPKGYNKLRISVIAGEREFDDFKFDYQEPFRYRWRAAFDLGTAATSCGSGVYSTTTVKSDGDCIDLCSRDDSCMFYSFMSTKVNNCLLSAKCDYHADPHCEATYQKYNKNVLYSSLVDAQPGVNSYTIGGVNVSINLPAENQGTKGIIWSDPCISGRWVGCHWGEQWDVFNRSALMLNAINQNPDVHYFQILGDNFYDQDGRLTRAMFNQFSLETKSKILMTVAGNHDIWVCGSPSCSDEFDQSGNGFMQWYAQDTLASTLAPQSDEDFISFKVNPDETKAWDTLNNDHANFVWYNKLGNLGYIGYVGAAALNETLPYLEAACSYMGKVKPEKLILLGHWNSESSGCAQDMDVPLIFARLQTIPGCDIGEDFIYFDGHTHCNHIEKDGGYMIGGHGMSGCSQFGFNYVDSTGDRLRVYYFEERNATVDSFDSIYECVSKSGIDACTHLAEVWLDVPLKANAAPVPTSLSVL